MGGLDEVRERYDAFITAHRRRDFEAACDIFLAAVAEAPQIAFRYFMCRASAPVAAHMDRTGRSPEVVALLDGLLDAHPDMHLLVDWDPPLIERIVALRDANIAKGLPSVAMITQGKAASVSVAAIFNSGFNLPSFAYSLTSAEVVASWARDYARGGACYATHLEPLPRNIARLKTAGIDKIIVHVRDPRQSLLSMIHHITRYPEGTASLLGSHFDEWDISAQVERLMEDYLRRVSWIQGWLDAEAELGVLFSTFEEFVRDRDAFIDRYLDFYGAPRALFSYADATRMHEGTDYHFRAGLTEEWRSVFPERDAEMLTAQLPAAMRRRFGWSD